MASPHIAAEPRPTAPSPPEGGRLGLVDWLRHGPFLAQLVVTRRCNLDCAYCTEFDQVSPPVPAEVLAGRLRSLARLRTWAVCLTGGEPTLHPDLVGLVAAMRELGFRRRQAITNGYKLTRELIESLNDAGLTDLQISVDGVAPNAATKKVLAALRPKLDLLAAHARFQVTMSGVIGSAPPDEAREVVEYAEARGFSPRVLLIHDSEGRLDLAPDERALFDALRRRLGRRATEAHDYRRRLLDDGSAPFKCRSGSRYLYVDEHGAVHWCSQTRGQWTRPLAAYSLADLREQFDTEKPCHAQCTVGCARTASAWDEWRPQPKPPG